MIRPIRAAVLCSAIALLDGCVTPTGQSSSQKPGASSSQGVSKFLDQVLPDSGVKQVLQGATQVAHDMTPEEERQLGQEMSAVLLGARPLVKNAQVQRYLNQVGLWIALQSDQPALKWRFGMIDTPNMNAFAAPGGYVFITRGLFLRLRNEAELAGVLGHEIGHVIKRHHVNAVRKQGLGKIAFGLAQAQAEKSGSLGGVAATNLFKGLYASGLDKADEYEADRVGMVLAARAGYTPFGLPSVLQMYAAASGDGALDLLFATHPSANDRLNTLDAKMGSKFDSYVNAVMDVPRLKKMQQLVR